VLGHKWNTYISTPGTIYTALRGARLYFRFRKGPASIQALRKHLPKTAEAHPESAGLKARLVGVGFRHGEQAGPNRQQVESRRRQDPALPKSSERLPAEGPLFVRRDGPSPMDSECQRRRFARAHPVPEFGRQRDGLGAGQFLDPKNSAATASSTCCLWSGSTISATTSGGTTNVKPGSLPRRLRRSTCVRLIRMFASVMTVCVSRVLWSHSPGMRTSAESPSPSPARSNNWSTSSSRMESSAASSTNFARVIWSRR